MSVYVIYMENRAKKMRPVTDEAEYRALRNSQQLMTVEAVRRGDAKQKMRLVQMNYSCLPNDDGTLKGTTRMSTTVGMDVDILRNENEDETEYQKRLAEIPAKVLAKKDELGLLMLERSATKGYHLVFRRRPELSQEENLRWASDLLGVEFDKGAKDITRVFFTTSASEEDLIFLDEAIFGLPQPLQGGETEVSNATPQGGETGASNATSQEEADGSNLKSLPLGGEGGGSYSGGEGGGSYLGIPYSQIIRKWWELYNDGQEPCPGNRNTLTFELAVNLRHICGFDRELLNKVIPDYWATDGDSQSSPSKGERGGREKMACIDSAINERRTQMPKRLRDVLIAVQRDILLQGGDKDSLPIKGEGWEEGLGDLYHFDRLPKMPQGVRDSIDAAGHPLAMPTLIAIAPAIGALATGVKLDVHGKARGLNLCSFVVGEFASGKGQMDDIIAAWMAELQAEADIYTEQEEEWAAKTKRMKSGKAPEQPKLPVRMLTLNNTVANIAERLANTEGKHSYSFTPEADNVALKWKQSVSDFSVMLRQAYDEARYDREAKSADAVRVHIQKLLWNVTMCGTQDALYRVITNYTDGLLSRVAIARTPDNTFSPLAETPAQLTDLQQERIQQVAHLLPLMTGTVVLPKLEERGRQWLETIRLEAMKNDDRVLARQRMRGCVNAMRVTTALWLPKVAELLIKKYGMNGAETRLKREPELWIEMLRRQQTDEMLRLFDIVADYMLDNDLYFFRSRIEQAYESRDYHGNPASMRSRRGRNDSIFERLDENFSFEQAYQQTMAVKGTGTSHNAVQQMLKNWRKQGLVVIADDARYKKVKS